MVDLCATCYQKGFVALSKKIRDARLAAGLSQSELARKLGVTTQSVSWWETGGDPRLSHLRKIARVTKTTVAELVE